MNAVSPIEDQQPARADGRVPHDDAFFCRTKAYQEQVLAAGKARPHHWPQAGYVTSMVNDEGDLEPLMELIRMSHQYFAGKQDVLRTEQQVR